MSSIESYEYRGFHPPLELAENYIGMKFAVLIAEFYPPDFASGWGHCSQLKLMSDKAWQILSTLRLSLDTAGWNKGGNKLRMT